MSDAGIRPQYEQLVDAGDPDGYVVVLAGIPGDL